MTQYNKIVFDAISRAKNGQRGTYHNLEIRIQNINVNTYTHYIHIYIKHGYLAEFLKIYFRINTLILDINFLKKLPDNRFRKYCSKTTTFEKDKKKKTLY